MKSNNKNSLFNLTKKSTAVFSAALSALTGVDATPIIGSNNENLESNTIYINKIGKIKPMPVLKLNLNSIDDSQFISSHTSHRSHSSHRSHYSHYSHRSGALFS